MSTEEMLTTTTVFHVRDRVLAAKVLAVIEAHETAAQMPPGEAGEAISGKPFIGTSAHRPVSVPHGEALRKVYKGHTLEACIIDGKVCWDGTLYDTLTGAALAAGRSIDPACHAPNGYEWWRVFRNGKWIGIDKSDCTTGVKVYHPRS